MNFFNLEKGLLLQKTDRVDIKSLNSVTRCKDQSYSNFIASLVQESISEADLGNENTIFGAKLDTDNVQMSDLFSFQAIRQGMELEHNFSSKQQNTSTLMNAFVC